MKKPDRDTVEEFIHQSNLIEKEPGAIAYYDAMHAWNDAFKHIETRLDIGEQDVFNVDFALGVHHNLMSRLNPRIAGNYRWVDIWIGGVLKCFVSFSLFDAQLGEIFDYMNETIKDEDMLADKKRAAVIAKKCHVDFEHVHPFEDGNGRTGRILYNLHRLLLGLDLHVIHVGEEQEEYYNWF